MDQATKKTVKTFCYQCVAGPDLMEIEVENGTATRVEALYGIQDAHPGGGRVCVKAYGLIQKTYNPHRIKAPMKRTNPIKSKDQDPGFVEISWDEALEIISEKLKNIIAALFMVIVFLFSIDVKAQTKIKIQHL